MIVGEPDILHKERHSNIIETRKSHTHICDVVFMLRGEGGVQVRNKLF